MRNMLFTLSVTLVVLVASPLQAGGVPDKIFESSFEFGEQCKVFGGLNDAIIVPVIEVTGNFTLNGGNFPASEYDDGVFSLRHRLTGDGAENGAGYICLFGPKKGPDTFV